MDSSFNFAAEPGNKAVTLAYDFLLNVVHTRKYRQGFSSLKILKEPVRSAYLGVRFKDFSPFYHILNEQIMRMFESGLVQQYREVVLRPEDLNFVEKLGPQVLTLDYLGIGFIFCLIPMTVAIVLFVIEILIAQGKVFGRRLIWFCVMKEYLKFRKYETLNQALKAKSNVNANANAF